MGTILILDLESKIQYIGGSMDALKDVIKINFIKIIDLHELATNLD